MIIHLTNHRRVFPQALGNGRMCCKKTRAEGGKRRLGARRVQCSEKNVHFENRPRPGRALIRLLCLDAGPLWEFASGILTIPESVLTPPKINYLAIGLQDPGKRHMDHRSCATTLPPFPLFPFPFAYGLSLFLFPI